MTSKIEFEAKITSFLNAFFMKEQNSLREETLSKNMAGILPILFDIVIIKIALTLSFFKCKIEESKEVLRNYLKIMN